MTKDNLLNIYTFGEYAFAPRDDKTFLNIPKNGQWFVLEKEKLSQTEITLLETLFTTQNHKKVNGRNHPWYGFLFQGVPLEDTSGSYRIIQFQLVGTPSEESKIDWLHAFSSMFNQVTDFFFLDTHYGVIVEQKSRNNYSLDELEGIMLTLESDFMIKCKTFLGSFFNLSDGFPRFYQEEKQIFLEELPNLKSKSVFGLPQVALRYFTKGTLESSLIMQVFRKQLSIDIEMRDIILALWHNQGNISSAAKALFMHRNTLQYRIEKFHEQTGLSLKIMDDLVLSYLLVS